MLRLSATADMVSYPTADGDHRPLPVRRAFGAGVAGWAVGYLSTVVLVLLEGGLGETASLRGVDGPLETLRGAVLVFQEAQFATTEVRIGAHEGSARLLPQVAGTVPQDVYHLLPAVAVVAVAAVFVRAVPFRPASAEASAALGGAVAVGYLPLTLLAAGVLTLPAADATLSTALTPRLAYPAIVYPTTAGLLGGAIAWWAGPGRG